MNTNDVVVGVDGSEASWDALRWATDEATRHGSRLRVVAAYRPPWPAEELAAGTELAGVILARTEDVVADMVAHARERAPGIVVSGMSVAGGAVPVLLAAAARAGLLVVGSHGHGGFASLLLGATGMQVAAHASVPVVVVRGDRHSATAPIAVGADGSAGAEAAVARAFDEAAHRDCGLVAIRAYPDTGPDTRDPVLLREHAHTALAASIAPWRSRYPQVPVDLLVTPADAAEALVDASRTAALVVVGTRGHGGFTGLLLGSVGVKLLHHADCPVLIARPVSEH